MVGEQAQPAVRVDNEFGLVLSQNLPNHTMAMAGKGKFIVPTATSRLMQFRTKQQVYRFAAHLLHLAGELPDEDGMHTLDEVLDAVEGTVQ